MEVGVAQQLRCRKVLGLAVGTRNLDRFKSRAGYVLTGKQHAAGEDHLDCRCLYDRTR